MRHTSIKEVVANDPSVIVSQHGTGPAAGGLWNTSIMVGDGLVLSCPGRYCLGGATLQRLDAASGLYGKKEPLDLPGGSIAWWPAGGFITYEVQWATVFYHPVDGRLRPVPGASYPILSHAGVPGFPGRAGQNVATGDVTGDGRPDIVLSLKDWGGDGYFPDGHRWSSPGYRPYQQREGVDPGADPRRDERLPFWGSKALSSYQEAALVDEFGHVRLECKAIFGKMAGDDLLCTALPRDGPCGFSSSRTYRGRAPASWLAVFAGDGSEPLPSIDGDENARGAFEYTGVCRLEDGLPLATFADSGVCILPGGILTVDFVGEIQYFRRVGPGLVFKEMPVFVQGGKIPAIPGCIGTVSLECHPGSVAGSRVLISGEYGLTTVVPYQERPGGLWIDVPDDNLLIAREDHFKEDILVVPSFVDEQVAILGSGAGRYARATFGNQAGTPVASKIAPYSRIRVQAGPVGSVQGTTEERWGYTCPCVYDVAGDGNRVVISGDISEYLWLVMPDGRRVVMRGDDGKPVRVAWRVRPAVFSLPTGTFLVTLDPSNVCTVYELAGTTLRRVGVVTAPDGTPLGGGKHGGSRGRLKLEVVQGVSPLPDILIGTPVGTSLGPYTSQFAVVARARSCGNPGDWSIAAFEIMGIESAGEFSAITFGHHSCAPATVPVGWDGKSPKQGTRIVVGAEDGRLYDFPRPRFFTI